MYLFFTFLWLCNFLALSIPLKSRMLQFVNDWEQFPAFISTDFRCHGSVKINIDQSILVTLNYTDDYIVGSRMDPLLTGYILLKRGMILNLQQCNCHIVNFETTQQLLLSPITINVTNTFPWESISTTPTYTRQHKPKVQCI